ncbi:hypothetical protein H5410_062435 [Solanum commersonii]|uniref:Uncharacterized protein n=1 Tax=Solanum commersonii TaxID=4109 RepID=A0A9J5WAV1_SOLCO|nr:hypothetical protein H5410_062435 [Solanum commersonii]
MVVYYRGKAAKYFDKDEARKCVYRWESIVWNETMLSRPHRTYYIDDGKAPTVTSAKSFILPNIHLGGRDHGMVLEDNLDVMVEKVGSRICYPFRRQKSRYRRHFQSQDTTLRPNIKALQETSKTSKDRCWKRQRVEPSRVNAAGHPLGLPHEMPQVSDESIAISKPKAQSISNIEQEQKTSSTSPSQLFKVEEGEKAKHVSSNKKSLEEANILATEDEISSYENMSLLTLEDSLRLEQKKECLEASRQDLTNYKLRLD